MKRGPFSADLFAVRRLDISSSEEFFLFGATKRCYERTTNNTPQIVSHRDCGIAGRPLVIYFRFVYFVNRGRSGVMTGNNRV